MSRKKKVLFVLHLPPPIHGAAVMGKNVQDSQLINDVFECRFINLSASKSISKIGKLSVGKFWFLISSYFLIIKTAIQFKPDLCYITPSSWDWGFYRDFIIVQSLKLINIPIIAHFHNKSKPGWLQSKHNFFLNKIFYRKIKIILLAKELYYEKKLFISDKDVYYCPNGITKIYALNTKKEVDDKFRFLFLSNMMEEKGVFVLLNACKILKEKNYSFEIHFIGKWADISEEDFNNFINRNNLQDYVIIHGAKYNDEKNDIFLQSDVFVFPTYYHGETFGLVLLEAMQFSLPCITTLEGGIPSVVKEGETGYLVNPKNYLEFAEKMEFLLNNKSLAVEMGKNGKKLFEEKFTIEKFEKRFAEILKDALNIE